MTFNFLPSQNGCKHQRKRKSNNGYHHNQKNCILHGADEFCIDPVNSLVSGDKTQEDWVNGIKEMNDQMRENLVQ